MKFMLLGVVLAGAAYFFMQTPAGHAIVLQIAAAGQALTSNIVRNMTH
jgi:hypothetical protein